MTKAQALYNFFSSFGLPAYEENAVYAMDKPPAFPYITYELTTDSFQEDNNGSPISASLWYRSASWAECNAKAEEISAAVSSGGKMYHFDGGSLWIKRGSPFAQSMGDALDDMVRRKVLSFMIEFFCED